MKFRRSVKLLIAACAAAVLLTPFGAAAPKPPRTIDIVARQFQFTPNTIRIKKGETVTLRLTTADVTHGFFLRPLKINADIQPGKTTEVTIKPETAGTYTLICDHFCGVNHGNMNMNIVVEE